MHSAIDWSEISRGQRVWIAGERGHFTFQYANNHGVTVYGGDPNPNGNRGYRTFPPAQVSITPPERRRRSPVA